MRLRCDSFSSVVSQNDVQWIKINKTSCNRIIILNRSIGVVNCLIYCPIYCLFVNLIVIVKCTQIALNHNNHFGSVRCQSTALDSEDVARGAEEPFAGHRRGWCSQITPRHAGYPREAAFIFTPPRPDTWRAGDGWLVKVSRYLLLYICRLWRAHRISLLQQCSQAAERVIVFHAWPFSSWLSCLILVGLIHAIWFNRCTAPRRPSPTRDKQRPTAAVAVASCHAVHLPLEPPLRNVVIAV